MNEAAIQEVTRLEDQRCQALVTNDFATMQTLFSDDLMYTHSSAKVDTKASYIESMRSGQVKYKKMDREDVSMHVHGDAVFITGKARITVQVQGEEKLINARYSNVWVKTNKGWQFALWHATPIPK